MGHIFLPYIAPATSSGPVTKATAYTQVINDSTDNQTSYTATTSYTAAGGANNCLVALIAWDADQPADPSQTVVTYDGNTMTYATGVAELQGPRMYVAIFYLMNPPTTSNVNLSVAFYQSDGTTTARTDATVAGLVELAGVNSSTPTGNTDTLAAGATAIDPKINITPANDDSWLLYVYADGGGGGGKTASTDLTTLDSGQTGAGSFADVEFLMGEVDVGTAASVDIGPNDATVSNFASCVVEFRP